MLDQYLSQTPQEDAGPYSRFIQIVEHPFEDECCPCIVTTCSLMLERITQLERPLTEASTSLVCPYSFAGCPFTSSSKLSWMYHIHFDHLKLEYSTYTAQGGCGPPSNVPYHVAQSEILFTNQKRQYPTSMRCSAPGCSVRFFGVDALRQWLDHIYTHLQQLTTLDDSQTIFKVIEGNTEFIQWSNSANAGIICKTEPDGRWTLCKSLCELLKRSTLDDTPTGIDQPGCRQSLSHISLSHRVKDPSATHRYSADGISITYTHRSSGYLDPSDPKNQMMSRFPIMLVSRSYGIHSRAERRKEGSPTVSGYSSSPLSLPMDEMFSRGGSPYTGSSSVSTFPDNDSAASDNLKDEQVSRSDLVDEFVHLTMSWFMTWFAGQMNNTEPCSDNQETQTRGGEDGSQCICGKGRKRPRGNDDTRKNNKMQRTNGDESGDGRGEPPTIAEGQSNLSSGPLFACPFFQRNPSCYGQGRWKICAYSGWKSYHRVRLVSPRLVKAIRK
ncbi:hypothetical protein V8C37DRAFT_161996 [Trichoderma ceciliae]